MVEKIGRNDPCSCGSGRKYKHCCLPKIDAPVVEPKEHDGAAERAIAWLGERHRKPMRNAFDELLGDLVDPEELNKLGHLDEQTWVVIQINLTEWLLAEGQLVVKGVRRRVSDYLLGPDGPLLTVGQRNWLQQLAQRPLRIYDVTDVLPGVEMTLCDALDTDAAPIVVWERAGTQSLDPGAQIGCRVMHVHEHYELSGAVYPFSMLAGPAVIAKLRKAVPTFGQRQDMASRLSMSIISAWLQQFVAPPPIPTIMDAYSGEPMLLINDHYRVMDWEALSRALSGCDDVRGDRQAGWGRCIKCEDGQTRAIATINIGKGVDRIELFYKTQRYADQGRAWFDSLAGGAVRFLTREVSDPKGLMAKTEPGGGKVGVAATPPHLNPATLAELTEAAIRRLYAGWADEPIPALDNKTPRQAIQTASGLERVKGLLRSYEASEERQAAEQGRRAISYKFLWEAIGVAP